MLKNKVAVITGGGSGIGQATSLLLSRNGAKVIVLERNDEAAHEVVETIRKEGGQATAHYANVASSSEVSAAFDKIQNENSKIDILVNSAGIYHYKTAIELTEEEWDDCMDIDLKGTWLCCKYALPLIIAAGGGSIINIGSTHAVRAQSNAFPYGAAKGGVLSLTLSLAADYGRNNIRANVICPGLVFTPLTVGLFESNPRLNAEQMVSMQPLPVRISSEDVANSVLFLASDMARSITGETLFVDGGRTTFSGIRHKG